MAPGVVTSARTRLTWSAPGWGKGSKRATGTHPREGGNRVRLVYQADGQTAERGRGGSWKQRIPALLSGAAERAEDRDFLGKIDTDYGTCVQMSGGACISVRVS